MWGIVIKSSGDGLLEFCIMLSSINNISWLFNSV